MSLVKVVRSAEKGIFIGPEIRITVLSIHDGQVELLCDVPPTIAVTRVEGGLEMHLRRQAQIEAAHSSRPMGVQDRSA